MIYDKLINTNITFTADATMSTHVWTVDGVVDTNATNVLTKSFSTTGQHTVKHDGTNSCGNCSAPVTETINIYETLPDEAGTSPILIIGLAAGALYMIMSGKK